MERKRKYPSRVRRWVLSAAAIAAAMLLPMPGRANLIISVQSVSALAGSTGNVFDVSLENTGTAVTIGSFALEINTADTDINFTAASIATVLAPYIFSGNSFFGPSIGTNSGPTTTLDASDAYDVLSSGINLASGETVGLAEISFEISDGAAVGPFAVSLSSSGTSLSDPDGNTVPPGGLLGLVDGQITVEGTSVPEPGTVLLAAGALLWLGLRAVRLARRTGHGSAAPPAIERRG